MTATPKVDGRRQRSARTREAILDALLDLVEGGHYEPTAAAIAERAGIALRSIGQHFPSRDALFLAAAGRFAERVGPRPPLPEGGSFADRLARFAAVRAKDLEAGAALRRAVAIVDWRSQPVTRAIELLAKLRRAEVAQVFAPELEAYAGSLRKGALDRLDLATQGRAWDGLRRDLGLSRPGAEKQLCAMVSLLLAQPR